MTHASIAWMLVTKLRAVAKLVFLRSEYVTASSTVQWEMTNSDVMVVTNSPSLVTTHKTNSLHLNDEQHPHASRVMTDVTVSGTV